LPPEPAPSVSRGASAPFRNRFVIGRPEGDRGKSRERPFREQIRLCFQIPAAAYESTATTRPNATASARRPVRRRAEAGAMESKLVPTGGEGYRTTA
jgi:hypothetical protein